MGKIRVNDPIRPRELTTIQVERITIPVPEFRTHLQFRRFAGCPGRNLHLRSIAKQHDEIRGAGLREVVVFYSSAQARCRLLSARPRGHTAADGLLREHDRPALTSIVTYTRARR